MHDVCIQETKLVNVDKKLRGAIWCDNEVEGKVEHVVNSVRDSLCLCSKDVFE